jgi:hypothetical protein
MEATWWRIKYHISLQVRINTMLPIEMVENIICSINVGRVQYGVEFPIRNYSIPIQISHFVHLVSQRDNIAI